MTTRGVKIRKKTDKASRETRQVLDRLLGFIENEQITGESYIGLPAVKGHVKTPFWGIEKNYGGCSAQSVGKNSKECLVEACLSFLLSTMQAQGITGEGRLILNSLNGVVLQVSWMLLAKNVGGGFRCNSLVNKEADCSVK